MTILRCSIDLKIILVRALHEHRVGRKILPVYNEIHGTIAIYSSPKLRNERPRLNFALHITYIRAYMPSCRPRRLDMPLI